jgi:hypothetical protein
MHDGHSEHDHRTHEHEHGHEHAHGHAGDCREGDGDGGPADAPKELSKIAAVLGYTLAHNARHAEELDILTRKLRRAGSDAADGITGAAANAIDAAGEDFRRGDEKLSEALRLLKEVTD